MAGQPPPNQRVSLECPECGHIQTESAMVLSTHCRSCRAYYQVVSGKPVARPRTVARFGKPPSDEPAEEMVAAPSVAAYAPPARTVPPPKPPHPLLRFFHKPKPPRDIACFSCDHRWTVAGEAQSTQCPACSSYISLVDHQIAEAWNREIHTRGNVTILKSGSVSASSLRAHDLTVFGALRAPAACSGDVSFLGSGRCTGVISCRMLRVGRRAVVEFVQPVTAERVVIEGTARGQIICSGPVVLRARARLHGHVLATSLVTESGAVHQGVFETLPAET